MTKKRALPGKIYDATKLTMPKFCLEFLHCNYKAFQYRVREGRCNPNEIIFISWYLGETVEDLFGKPFTELMIGQGDSKVSDQLVELFHKKDPQIQKQLMGLLGGGISLGVSSPKIRVGVSTERIEAEIAAGRLRVPGPAPGDLPPMDIYKKPKAVTNKAQKKAPILNTTVEDLAPKKKADPFDILQDFRISR